MKPIDFRNSDRTLKGFNLSNSGCNPELRIAGRPNPEGRMFVKHKFQNVISFSLQTNQLINRNLCKHKITYWISKDKTFM